MKEITIMKPSTKVINLSTYKMTKEDMERGRENLKKFYERREKITKALNKLRYGKCR